VYWNLFELWNENECLPRTIDIDGTPFIIHLDKLFIKKEQTVIFKSQGIPIGNTSDIFDITKKSNVYIHIHFITNSKSPEKFD
jgi:hypothetical protein